MPFLFSGESITAIVVNLPERKLANVHLWTMENLSSCRDVFLQNQTDIFWFLEKKETTHFESVLQAKVIKVCKHLFFITQVLCMRAAG